ncbi:MAG: hypothetical protein BWY56_02588 [Acidobacteria bacterium ADurb.Bin340]|nr:MAG: hypothetical protein BWY56_02588 [Acidobacteria bacterium ADurb.Bin340]
MPPLLVFVDTVENGTHIAQMLQHRFRGQRGSLGQVRNVLPPLGGGVGDQGGRLAAGRGQQRTVGLGMHGEQGGLEGGAVRQVFQDAWINRREAMAQAAFLQPDGPDQTAAGVDQGPAFRKGALLDHEEQAQAIQRIRSITGGREFHRDDAFQFQRRVTVPPDPAEDGEPAVVLAVREGAEQARHPQRPPIVEGQEAGWPRVGLMSLQGEGSEDLPGLPIGAVHQAEGPLFLRALSGRAEEAVGPEAALEADRVFQLEVGPQGHGGLGAAGSGRLGLPDAVPQAVEGRLALPEERLLGAQNGAQGGNGQQEPQGAQHRGPRKMGWSHSA